MSTLRTNAIQTTGGKPILNSTGSILQVVQTIKTDTFAGSTNGWIDVTGMSAAITPSNSANKILITISLGAVGNGDAGGTPHTTSFRIIRNSSAVSSLYGNVEGSRPTGNLRTSTGYNGDHCHGYSFQVLDSPNATTAQTYQLQMWPQSGSTAYVNRDRSGTDFNETYRVRTSSTITLMEISA